MCTLRVYTCFCGVFLMLSTYVRKIELKIVGERVNSDGKRGLGLLGSNVEVTLQ